MKERLTENLEVLLLSSNINRTLERGNHKGTLAFMEIWGFSENALEFYQGYKIISITDRWRFIVIAQKYTTILW